MSVRRAVSVGTLGAMVAAAACGGGEQTPSPPPPAPAVVAANASVDDEPPPPFFGCLTADSATYSDVRIDTISGDTTGIAFTFWRAGDGVDGAVVQSSDPSGTPAPFLRIQLGASDSIAFDMLHPTEPDTIRFIGRVSCERLWGRQRNRRNGPGRAALYRRSY